MTQIGKKIKMERILTGMKQMDLAKKAGLSQKLVSEIETGKKVAIRSSTAEKICKVFKWKLSQFFE